VTDAPPGSAPIAAGPQFPWMAFGFLLLWTLLSCVDAQVAFSRTQLHMAVDDLGWTAGPGLWPSLLALVLLTIASARRRQGARGFGRLASLAAILCLLRLLSLWQPLGALFPYLSVLWSPHASWALATSVLAPLVPSLRAAAAIASAGRWLTPARIAACLFVLCSVTYGSWAVYVSQLTMVHGDEAHYLLVTQSLHRDADYDLHNNGSRQDIAEFRQLPFDMHRAPSSPPGKSYSIHPPGLPTLMLPAYAVGVALWQNPRLACYLFMCLVAASVLSLLFLWLTRLAYSRGLALLTTLIVGSVAPTVFFNSQLYPDLPAIFIAIVILLLFIHWQTGGTPRLDFGRHEPWILFFLALPIGALPFLHPRFTPLALLLGIPLLLQAHTSHLRSQAIGALAVAVILCGGTHLGYNIAVSDDWLGHLRPGNAWDGEALDLRTWQYSLPGHWLHATKGLVVNAPILLLAFVGAGRLLRDLDRRLLVAAGLYAATVVVNGMHPEWSFGFGMPARFMMSGMPALALLLCAGLGSMLQRVSTLFVVAILLAMSWDTLAPLLPMPTMAYDGEHLFLRSMARFYPIKAHLLVGETSALTVADGLLWATILLALFGLGHGLGRPWRLSLVLFAATLSPLLWGLAPASASRLAENVSPFLVALSDEDPGQRAFPVRHTRGLKTYLSSTGSRHRDGTWVADPDTHAPGLLVSHYLPFQRPGIHEVSVDGFTLRDLGGAPDHVVFTSRRTLPAVQRWEMRQYLPLSAAEGVFRRVYISESYGLGYLYFPFSARRELTVGTVSAAFHPLPVRISSHPLKSIDTTVGGDGPFFFGVDHVLDRGRYRAHFSLEGGAWGQLFVQHPVPVLMAVIAAPADAEQALHQAGDRWLHEERRLTSVFADTSRARPLVERVEAPWWMHIPGDDEAYDLVFSVPDRRRVRLLMRYDGPAELRLRQVSLFAEQVLQ